METKSDDSANSINATSKPRGTYLDPLKACALSGESGVNIGKSESATYSKYMNIVRQTRRTASRVSVLNDVERSRLNSVMRRIDGERAYSTAVLDRQKRQFKRSLDNLDKHKSGFTHHIDEIATPAHLRAKQSLLTNHRKHQIPTLKPVQEYNNDQPNPTSEILPKNENNNNELELPAVVPLSRTPYFLRSREKILTATAPGEVVEQKGESIPIFYTGDGPEAIQEQVRMVHNRKDFNKSKAVIP
ncbi:uncharacterized protein [Asterias amurensis]|uniref:uncharacterized protein isoform X1 n=1 Tax=Asterias amurensis TaxID=7602 RepID=UPI003AB7C8AE